VNVVALTVTFMGAVSGYEPPLNAIMMLWVNLIMDTMGALALGTEAPTQVMLLLSILSVYTLYPDHKVLSSIIVRN
jgi:magnesium-transporting ATPase (P-type)